MCIIVSHFVCLHYLSLVSTSASLKGYTLTEITTKNLNKCRWYNCQWAEYDISIV